MDRTRSVWMVLGLRLQSILRQRVVDSILHDVPLNKCRLEEYHFQQRPQRQGQHLSRHLDLQHRIQQRLHRQLQLPHLFWMTPSLEAMTFRGVMVKTGPTRFHFLQRLIQIMLHVGGIAAKQRQDQRTLSRRSRSCRTTSSRASTWAR